MSKYYVYILTNNSNGTLYVGMTKNPKQRAAQHKYSHGNNFTAKYSVRKLIYVEEYRDAEAAIKREKQMKKWRREWKIRLIEKINPGWKNLIEKG
jgi:putative endonuclease